MLLTYEDSTSLQSSLEDLILSLSGSLKVGKSLFREKLYADQLNFVEDYLKTRKVDLSDKEKILEALNQLQEDLKRVTPVDLGVAVEPDDSFKEAIVAWLSKNVSERVLPRYKVDPAFVGGAKVTYNGIYLDLSLRKKIDESSILKRKV